MNVRLISYSKPPEEIYVGENIQELIAYCARVSNPSNQDNAETSERLLQLLRHRSFSFQEFSQRYADPTKDLSTHLRKARLQDKKNRQNSIDTDDPDLQLEWYQQQAEVINVAKKAYGWAIEKGIAKEQARAVLPEGIMDSRLYVNGTIRSWIHYVDLRSGNGTQKEHIEVAQQCALALKPIFPMIMEFCHGADKI